MTCLESVIFNFAHHEPHISTINTHLVYTGYVIGGDDISTVHVCYILEEHSIQT